MNISVETRKQIKSTMKRIEKLLISKNLQYGDSVMEPIGLFAKGNVEDLVRVRIDDKLSRLKSGDDSIESDVDNLIGDGRVRQYRRNKNGLDKWLGTTGTDGKLFNEELNLNVDRI